MLEIVIPAQRLFDEKTNTFLDPIKETTLQLEHSLMAIRKWESKWKIPFINQSDKETKTNEQLIDYIRCMCIRKPTDQRIFDHIPPLQQLQIVE